MKAFFSNLWNKIKAIFVGAEKVAAPVVVEAAKEAGAAALTAAESAVVQEVASKLQPK